MKRKLWIILALAVLAAALCCTAALADQSGTCGDNVTWSFVTDTGTLTISGTGEMTDYSSSLSTPWYSFRSIIESVVIEDGVTSISSQAFFQCISLTSITIPGSVTSIGREAFYQCTGLTSVTIPYSVTSIESYAFYNSGITSVTVLNRDVSYGSDPFHSRGVETVLHGFTGSTTETLSARYNYTFALPEFGDGMTYDFSADGELTISGNGVIPNYSNITEVRNIPWRSLRNVITSLSIGSGVTQIGNRAFCDCTGLTEVTIPENVTKVGYFAFRNCTSLARVTVLNPSAVIGDTDYDVFEDCADGFILRGYTGSTAETYASHASGVSFMGIVMASSCGEDISYLLDSSGALTITGTGPMTDFTNSNASPFYNRQDVTNVVIGEGITNVGGYMFCGCSNLAVVSLPSTVTAIGNNAFYQCYYLTDIELPAGLTSIGSYAFYNCSKLPAITIPEGVSSIGIQTFFYCWKLTDVTVIRKTTGFASNAFSTGDYHPVFHCYRGSAAETYAIGKGFTVDYLDVIGSCGDNLTYTMDTITGELTISGTGEMYAFSGEGGAPWNDCKAEILSVEIGSGVTSIGRKAFQDCTNLSRVSIPDSVISIESSAFNGCTSLSSLTLPPNLTRLNDSVFRYCTSLTSVTIPDSVTSIAWYAFGYSGLTSVNIPQSVTDICNVAFYNCSNLTSATIQNPECNIGDGYDQVFDGCASTFVLRGWNPSTAKTYAEAAGHPFESLGDLSGQCGDEVNWTFDPVTGVVNITGSGPMWDYSNAELRSPVQGINTVRSAVISSGVTSVGSCFFEGCGNLESVSLPTSLRQIGYDAFMNCIRLTDLNLPNGITTIGDFAFACCDSLTSLTIPGSVTSIGNQAFDDCKNLQSLVLQEGVTATGQGAFINCASLTSVTLPSTLKTIGIAAFNGTSLTSVTIPNGVTSIGDHAFADTQLTSVTIPTSVTSIGEYAFADTYVTSITIPASMTSISKGVFRYCRNLTNITIPSSVTSIGDSAFYRTGLTDVTIPTSVTSIGSDAFRWCTSLRNVTIPNSVTSIGDSAFRDCYNLTGITIPNSLTSLGNHIFHDCTSLTSVSIPNSLSSFGEYAFCGTGLISVKLPNSLTSISYGAFASCSKLTSITIPDSVTSIGDYAFSHCTGLTYFSIPASVGTIGREAFACCDNLIDVSVHNAEATFGSYVFDSTASGFTLRGHSGSTAQTYANSNGHNFALLVEMGTPDFELPAFLTRIESEAFSGGRMTVVYIPDGVTFLGSKAFANCTSLTQIRIPASITTIPPDVFQGINKSQITIFGAPGSTAQTFASSAGIKFEVE